MEGLHFEKVPMPDTGSHLLYRSPVRHRRV